MKLQSVLLASFFICASSFAENVVVARYATHQDPSKAFVANLRAIPNTKFTLRSSDKAGGTIQAVRLVRNQELASLFVLVTQEDAGVVAIEATFTRNGGWFGGGDPHDWAKDYAEALKAFLPDLTEADQANGGGGANSSQLERVVPFRPREPIALNIAQRRVSVDSVEVTGWPSTDAIERAASQPDSTSKVVAVLTYSNRSDSDLKCEYVVTVLDAADHEIGTGRRMVSLDEGEIGDTHRVGITIRMADAAKASKLRVQVLPQ